MKYHWFLRFGSSLILCALSAGCGNESLPVSSSVASTSSSSVASSTSNSIVASSEIQSAPVYEGKLISTDMPVNGSLTLVKSNVLNDYDYFSAFQNGWAFVIKGEQAGYLSESGEFKPLYKISLEDLYSMDIDRTPLESPRTKCLDISYLTDHFYYGESGFVPYFKDGKWGYSDLDGNIVVEPIYDAVTPMDKLALVYIKEDENNLYVLDSKGNVIGEKECWIDNELGYYTATTETGTNLYNVDGTLLVTNIPLSYGNRPFPVGTFSPGGVILTSSSDFDVPEGSTLIIDRTGKQTTVTTS